MRIFPLALWVHWEIKLGEKKCSLQQRNLFTACTSEILQTPRSNNADVSVLCSVNIFLTEATGGVSFQSSQQQPVWVCLSKPLTLQMRHAASLCELVFLGGAKWSGAYQSAGYLSWAEHREAGTSAAAAAAGIKSVPSDAQGFMGLVKIAFPTVEIKHRRMFSTQAVE